jgi:hypothetical protein
MMCNPLIDTNEHQNPESLPLPGIIFILSPPRSGSTLLRVMLAGHPELFAPPELHLLKFASMEEREERLNDALWNGLQETLMALLQINADESAALIDEMEDEDLWIYEVYAFLQSHLGDRTLVDKSPDYGRRLKTLQRAETIFRGAKYIHLIRHPYAVIESCVKNLPNIFGEKLGGKPGNPYDLAEEGWRLNHQNILTFATQLQPEQYHALYYEELVRQPEQEMRRLCQFLEIPFTSNLINPYEGQRMTKGVDSDSSIGDPKFITFNTINPSRAEAWRQIRLPHRLSLETQKLATQLHYSLPHEEDWQEGAKQEN